MSLYSDGWINSIAKRLLWPLVCAGLLSSVASAAPAGEHAQGTLTAEQRSALQSAAEAGDAGADLRLPAAKMRYRRAACQGECSEPD